MIMRRADASQAGMWPYHPDLLATPVPRYTSFPTAAEFSPDVGAGDLAEAISTATGEVSLYLHIPFCEKICWYCGCNTAAANRIQRLESYLEALHHEIELVGALLPASTRIKRIAFGGGSPNALSPVDFVRLFEALVVNLPMSHAQVSIELDPRGLTDAWGDVIRGIGASHASLGVQTFDQRLQEAIGRVQPQDTIDHGVRMLREAGVTSLNFDLMYGLPGQSLVDLGETLSLASAYRPDRIALFGYAHVPHMLPRQRRIDASELPGQEARFRMAEAGHEQLVAAGYVPVGFDHFALPHDPLAVAAREGTLRRNFQGFTEDSAETLIGIGASAISSFPTLLAQNEKNTGRYRMMLSRGQLTAALGKRRSVEDRRRGAIIEELLCRGRARVDQATAHAVAERLAPFIEPGLAAYEGSFLAIAPSALPYARGIAAAFDPYRDHSPRRFSSAI